MMRATPMIGKAFVLLLVTSSAAAATAPREDPPELPPARVALHIDAAEATGPWKMVVTNTGTEMLRLAADGRLLRLEIRPPATAEANPPAKKAKKAKKDLSVECRAPASLRPGAVDDERAVALPPDTRYEETFDPALYCFDRQQREALVPGATVVAKLGFVPAAAKRGRPARQSRPYVAEPTSPTTAVSPVKEVVAAAFTIPQPAAAQPPAPAATPSDQADADPGAPRMEISAPRWMDSEGARSLTLPVTITNAGKRSLVARLRVENLSFDIEGPGGSALCQLWDGQRTLVRDFFKTMAPGGRESMTVLLGEVCPDQTFDAPGLYKVTPHVTLADEPGRSPVRAWTGAATAKQPTLVRVRSGSRPFYRQPPQVLTDSGTSR
jgi:hypothetical protein